ncbi:MAG: hypothetical protein ABEI53_02815 [Candidatus Magasanikbacteria bacterium]
MSTKNQKEGEDFDLSQALSNLRDLVDWFENQEEVDVEKGLEKVKEGADLIDKSKSRLKEIENEFEEVKNDLED